VRGFTKAPNAVVFDTSLSIGARTTHTALTHLTWQRNGKTDKPTPTALPSMVEIARLIGCSKTTLGGYMTELRAQGVVVSARIRHRSTMYLVFEQAADSEAELRDRELTVKAAATAAGIGPAVDEGSGPESGRDLGQNLVVLTGASGLRGQDQEEGDDLTVTPPGAVLVDGQNLALNALMAECSIDPKSPRVAQAAVALNDKGRTQGIRSLFWIEMSRWAADHGEEGRRWLLDAAVGGERYELALATAIERKAAMYRSKMPGAYLTPTALRNHWLDLEMAPSSGRGLTGEEARRLDL
jgi:hypothetical protein